VYRLVAAVLAFAVCVSAGEPWKLSLDANVTMTLNSYSENWAGSEVGALSWATQWTGVAEKQLNKSFNTKNTLKLAFGQTKVQLTTSKWSAPVKSTDLIDFETVWRTTLGTWVDPFISVHALSQFLDGRDPGLAHYGNPVELTEAFGAKRDLVKKERLLWDLRLAGAGRENIDRVWDSCTTTDGGLELVSQLDAALRKDIVKLTSTLKLYEALMREGSEKLNNDWKYPDISWENKLTVSLAKYIMISYVVQLLYDREVDANARFRQTLALGLTYGARSPKEAAAAK
jgi:hypothetical protein